MSHVWLACAGCQFRTAIGYEHSAAPLPVPGTVPLLGHLGPISDMAGDAPGGIMSVCHQRAAVLVLRPNRRHVLRQVDS
jgi:hypothetical protein